MGLTFQVTKESRQNRGHLQADPHVGLRRVGRSLVTPGQKAEEGTRVVKDGDIGVGKRVLARYNALLLTRGCVGGVHAINNQRTGASAQS